MTETYAALLRGINVGGKNKLPMKDLVEIFTAAGCGSVQSYIQSGNVVFETDAANVPGLPVKITALIAERFGYRVPLILRSGRQIEEAACRNPFLAQGAAQETLHIMFLADLPSPEQVAGLDPHRSAPDAFIVQGREIYLHLPQGVAETKLTNAYFDSKLTTTCTSRNWKTVTKLRELMR